MLQAEVGGGGRVDAGGGLQKPGYLIRDFVLTSALGVRVQISDYRGRSNLVLVFAGQAGIEFDVLRDAAKRYQDFTQQDAVVAAVFPYNSQETRLLKIWTTLTSRQRITHHQIDMHRRSREDLGRPGYVWSKVNKERLLACVRKIGRGGGPKALAPSYVMFWSILGVQVPSNNRDRLRLREIGEIVRTNRCLEGVRAFAYKGRPLRRELVAEVKYQRQMRLIPLGKQVVEPFLDLSLIYSLPSGISYMQNNIGDCAVVK
jgi:hypothetical protein